VWYLIINKFFNLNNCIILSYFIFIFFLNFFLYYTINSNYFDLGTLFNQINNPSLIFENYPYRLISFFYYFIPLDFRENSLIFLNTLFFFLPYFLLKKNNKIILLVYFTSPLIILGSLNTFHTDVVFIFLSLLNLLFYKKNNKIFFVTLFLIFITKDIFFYFQVFYIFYVIENKLNKLLNRLFISVLLIIIAYELNQTLVFYTIYKLFFIFYFFIIFFYLFANLRLLVFLLTIFAAMLIYDPPIQFYNIKGHNAYYFLPYILYNLIKLEFKHKYFFYFSIILNILCNIYVISTDHRFKALILSLNNLDKIQIQKKKISQINKKDSIIFTQNNINFFPKTKNYYPLKDEKTYQKLISKNQMVNVYIIVDLNKTFYIDDKKCSLKNNVCFSFLKNIDNSVSPQKYLSYIKNNSILYFSQEGFYIYKLKT
jgi:hypothetical protein